MQIYTQNNCPGLRDKFVKEVKNIFESSEKFLDYIENYEFNGDVYNCYYFSGDECYIINRETGEYINWYKFSHIGRDIHMNFNPKRLHRFIANFYNNSENEENGEDKMDCSKCMEDAPYPYCCKLECGEHGFCAKCNSSSKGYSCPNDKN